LICRILDYRGDHYFEIAAVSELVHSASLLHDDVVDNSTLRRQKPSANSIWGDQASVLVGDLIYSRASEMMAETGSLDIVSTFARAIRLMSEGELIQLENCFNPGMLVEDYLKIVEFKTATLLAAACRSAAVLAGVSADLVEAMTNYGKAVGMAFQIKDDALDYLATDDQLGKPALADLREGKVTLPVLDLLNRCNGAERTTVTTAIERGNPDLISELIERHGCVDSALRLAGTYTDEALRCLQTLPKNSDRDHLEALTIGLLMRRS
jgi:octaprenyl-diphosphate synthase